MENQNLPKNNAGNDDEGGTKAAEFANFAPDNKVGGSGVVPALLVLVLLLASAGAAAYTFKSGSPLGIAGAVFLLFVLVVIAAGIYTLKPNKAAVLTLFGKYKGTDTQSGLRFSNPFYSREKVSLRVRNFTTTPSKVNDSNGNPILIAAVVVWRVVDTARAVFEVDDFVDYVEIQSESAVRQLARSYPYDSFDDETVSTLIGDTSQINDHLRVELQERVGQAGVEVVEARITDLSYAPEIAEAMLRRQQAAAIVAARAKIVEGAVTMVRDAVEQLEAGTGQNDEIYLDTDRKATFASNLMTVITSDTPTSPVVNVGTLSR